MKKNTSARYWALTAVWASSVLAPVCASADAILSIVPSASAVSIGEVFSIDVNVSGAADLYGYQFDLTFNPSLVSASVPTEGSFLSSGGTNATFFIPGVVDNAGGTVSGTADVLLGAVPGVNGSGTLATFDFTAVGAGSGAFTLENILALDSNLNLLNISSTGGSVTVSPAIAIPEPEIGTLMVLALAIAAAAMRRRGIVSGTGDNTRRHCVRAA